jgi:C4-dicarboxylate transporter DctQ subunit
MEVAQLAFIYLAIFGGGLALINNEFTKVEFFVNLISKRVRKILEVLGNILILVFLIIAGYKSEELIYQAKITLNVTPALVIPMDYIYRILQIGFYIFAFFAITKVLILIFEKKIKGV